MTLPLEGYRVIDLTQVWAGPQLCGALADMGAEVVRVESLAGTDNMRAYSSKKSPLRASLERQWLHRNRRYYITLNLSKARAVELFTEIVRQSDVLVTNLSPRALSGLHIDYGSLSQVNPGLIMASISAAGQDGRWKDLLAYGPSVNCVVGTESLTGYPEDSGRPLLHVWDPDPGMATAAAFPIAMALFHRGRTGRGQHIDLAFTELLAAFLAEPILEYQMTGRVPQPRGNLHPRLAPHDMYPCSGEDAWVSIAVGTREEWEALCQAMGRPDLARDGRFRDAHMRNEHRDELGAIIARWTSSQTAQEVTSLLQAVGVAAAPVNSVADLYYDRHDKYLRETTTVTTPELHPSDITYGIPWRFSDTPGSIRRLAEPVGADNLEFFTSVLHLTADEIDHLAADQVIY